MNTVDKIILSEQLTDYELIKTKKINQLTFKDIVSLNFYAFELLSKTTKNHNFNYKEYYNDFLDEVDLQNKKGWPQLLINKNDYRKRVDACCVEPYINSKNYLMMLLRMMSIENYKRMYVKKSYDYPKVLGHKFSEENIINNSDYDCILQMTLSDLFVLTEFCIKYYLKIYHDQSTIEHKIGLSLLKYLD
jgi:hypothetical protein